MFRGDPTQQSVNIKNHEQHSLFTLKYFYRNYSPGNIYSILKIEIEIWVLFYRTYQWTQYIYNEVPIFICDRSPISQ